MEIIYLLLRTLLFYFIFQLTYNFNKNSFTVTSCLCALGIFSNNLLYSIIPLLLITILDYFYSKRKQENSLCIIKDGLIDFKKLLKNNFSISGLLIKLKENNISDLKTIKYAFADKDNQINFEIKR